MTSSVHLLATAQHRGAERFALDLVGAMKARGADASALALTAGGPPPLLPVSTLGTRARSPRTLRRVRTAVPRDSVVVAHGSSTLGAAAMALPGRAPFIYRSIGDPAYWASSATRRVRVSAYLRRAALVVVMWEEARRTLTDLYGGGVPVRLIPKGITSDGVGPVSAEERTAARAHLGLGADDRVVAYLGALSPEKDPLAAVAAVAAVPGLHLVLVGDGPLRPEVQAQVGERLPGRGHVVGISPDPRVVLAAADALVLASRTEGIPSAPLEAALLGLPAVVTDVGGSATTVEDGVTGRVVPVGDRDRMVAALREVVADAASMGAAARRFCLEQFAMEPVAAAWVELCDELGDQNGRYSKRVPS